MDKFVYVRRSITELRKMLMHKFLYDYRKPKYEEKTKCCSFLILRSFISFSMSELFILLKENDSGLMLEWCLYLLIAFIMEAVMSLCSSIIDGLSFICRLLVAF